MQLPLGVMEIVSQKEGFKTIYIRGFFISALQPNSQLGDGCLGDWKGDSRQEKYAGKTSQDISYDEKYSKTCIRRNLNTAEICSM
jgi:hypothetical protein